MFGASPTSVSYHSITLPPQPTLQAGLHGTEIRCIALHCLPAGFGNFLLSATGSEDNTLKISLVDDTNVSFRTLWRDSTFDGAVQNLTWNDSITQAGDAMLFASAARESLTCVRVRLNGDHTQRPQAKVKRLASAPRQPSMDESTRIMTMDACTMPDRTLAAHLILAGYSDGSLVVRPASFSLEARGILSCSISCTTDVELQRERRSVRTLDEDKLA